MPSRRTLLATLGTGGACALAGCSVGRPDVRLDGGVGVLHPVGERYVANGLKPDGTANASARVVPDRAPDVVGPDASHAVAERLRTAATSSTPSSNSGRRPRGRYGSRPTASSGADTGLVLDVTVSPWGSLSRIDDPALRQRLESAPELVDTTVRSLTPRVDDLPGDVELSITHRGG